MHYALQDNDNLYLIMDLLTGGDLRYHLCKQKHFSEAQTRKIIYIINLKKKKLFFLDKKNRIFPCLYNPRFRILSLKRSNPP